VNGLFEPVRCCTKVPNVPRRQERQNRLNDIFQQRVILSLKQKLQVGKPGKKSSVPVPSPVPSLRLSEGGMARRLPGSLVLNRPSPSDDGPVVGRVEVCPPVSTPSQVENRPAQDCDCLSSLSVLALLLYLLLVQHRWPCHYRRELSQYPFFL
jgi:hypothetical protein